MTLWRDVESSFGTEDEEKLIAEEPEMTDKARISVQMEDFTKQVFGISQNKPERMTKPSQIVTQN